MKKTILLIFVVLSISNCTPKNLVLTGKYSCGDNTNIDLVMAKVRGYKSLIGGVTLQLNEDSSFTSSSCSGLKTGKWSHSDNKIILNFYSCSGLLDGQDTVPTENKPMEFKIKSRTIECFIINGHGDKALLSLEKVN